MRRGHGSASPRRRGSLRAAIAAAIATVFVGTAFTGNAEAALPSACAAFAGGCGAQVQSLTDAQMTELRGGYRGVLFGISFFGDASRLLSQSDVDAPEGVTVDFTSDNVVSISAGLGSLPNGFNGVFQNTQVLGDFNTINNNLIINAVFVSDATDATAVFGL